MEGGNQPRILEIGKRGKIGFNHFLIHIHPFPLILTAIFYLFFFNLVAKKISWIEKILVRRNLFPYPTPSPSHAYITNSNGSHYTGENMNPYDTKIL
jgi:hypothetical protein